MEGRGLVLFLFLPHKGSDHSLSGGGGNPGGDGVPTTVELRPQLRPAPGLGTVTAQLYLLTARNWDTQVCC